MDIIVNKLLFSNLEICYCIMINKIYKYDFFFLVWNLEIFKYNKIFLFLEYGIKKNEDKYILE